MTDKFDILRHQVNGLTRMSEARPVAYQIEDLICDQFSGGIKYFEEMDDLDKDRLCALLTRDLGHDRAYAIIDMPDLYEAVNYFINYLNEPSMHKAHDLAEFMRMQLHERFADKANQLFREYGSEMVTERNQSAGLRKIVDQTNGEISWIK